MLIIDLLNTTRCNDIYLDALMLVTDLVHMNLSLFLQIMDIHSFMKLNFNPDISVLPQHTHTHSQHTGWWTLHLCKLARI